MNKSIGICVVIALAALVPRCSTDNTGSQTHWFDTCTRDTDCDPGASCLCGVCTRTCGTGAECDALSREATCVAASSPAHAAQCGDAGGAICMPSCASGCHTNEQCIDGACVVGHVPQKDASAESGGRDGTGGSSTAGAGGSRAGAGGSTGGVAGTGGRAGAGAIGSGGSADSGACMVVDKDPLSDPFCGATPVLLSGTVTAISRTAMCGTSAVPGYVITVQSPGMPSTDVPLALGDLPQPFEVGDHLEILTARPLFQFWLTRDLRKNGVTVVYTTFGEDKQLPPPLTLERGDALCMNSTPCLFSTVQSLRATAAGATVDILQNAHADIGDFRVFNVYVAQGAVVSGPTCPTDSEPNLFEIAVVRRAPVGGAPTDAGADAR